MRKQSGFFTLLVLAMLFIASSGAVVGYAAATDPKGAAANAPAHTW